MFIPGQLITAITFPGVIVHEAAHQMFCRFFRVSILDVCYFQFGNPAGYVVHETPSRPSHHVWIGIGPFLVNTVLGALIAAPAAIPAMQFNAGDGLDTFLIWLGVSIAMHAFPSTGDAESILQGLKAASTSFFTKLVAYPLVLFIYLGAIGSVFWLDLVYGVGVAMLVPNLLIWVLV